MKIHKADGKLLSEAIAFAAEKHKGQLDTQNLPYILHTLAVMQKVFQQTNVTDYLITALLHDVVEDCEVTIEELYEKFGFTVAFSVACLSKNIADIVANSVGGLLTYKKINPDDVHTNTLLFNYAERIKHNNIARVVKLCDLEHNASLERMPDAFSVNENAFRKMQNYQKLYAYLLDTDKVIENPFSPLVIENPFLPQAEK